MSDGVEADSDSDNCVCENNSIINSHYVDFINNIIDQKSKIRKKNWFNNINKDVNDSNNDDKSSS